MIHGGRTNLLLLVHFTCMTFVAVGWLGALRRRS